MNKIASILIVIFIVIPLALLIAGQCGMLSGHRPTDIGMHHRLLKAPGEQSLNVVTSQAAMHPHTAYHQIAPLTFSGDPAAAFDRLKKIIEQTEGTTIVVSQPDYLHAEFQTKYLKFTDDVEFMLDAAKSEIHMRSASRLGRKDFGANRARLEKIRAAFDAK